MKARKWILRLSITLVTLVVVLLAAAGFYLSQGKELAERHRPLAYAETFDFESGSFQDYIAYSETVIRAGRVDGAPDPVVANLLPFELQPGPTCFRTQSGKYANGIVLTHGLVESPYSMIDLAHYFQSRCFYVLGLLLPGHGTRPGDMLVTSWEEWAEAEHFAARQLEQQADTVYLSGHSVGGALSVYEAANNPAVKALILFAPALQISAQAKFAKYVVALSGLFPKAAWLSISPDEALYRYESFPVKGAEETYALTEATEAALVSNPLTIPVFSIASVEDNTVNTGRIVEFMAANTNPDSRTLLYSQHPLEMDSPVTVISSNDEAQQVLSVSHLGLMMSELHPYFGRFGSYRNCGHYEGRSEESFARCKSGERDFYGETTGENLQRGIVERIAFNPFFHDMLLEVDHFMEALGD